MFARFVRGCFLATVIVSCSTAAYAGKVELSTYYPSPYGEYTNLKSTGNASFATSTGQVSIGTATPTGKFRIDYGYDAASPRADHIYLSDPNNTNLKAYIGLNRNSAAGADQEYFAIEGVEEGIHWLPVVLAAEGGNVGIGRTNPAQKLDVVGNIAVSGTVKGKNLTLSNTTVSSGCVAANTVTVTCPAGYTATGSGWEPCANWEAAATTYVSGQTTCYGYAVVNTNWQVMCACTRID